MDVLSHFGGLDELIQVVYQGFERFIILSTINEPTWVVYVGLKGPEGRWWRGSWTAEDIKLFLGSKSGSQSLESFARNLYEAFVNGELCIGDWAPDKGAKINLTLGPTSKKPVHIPLVELSAKEAASHATNVLSAHNHASVDCIHPRFVPRPPQLQDRLSQVRHGLPQEHSRDKPRISQVPKVHSPPKKALASGQAPSRPTGESEAAQRKIKSLEAELAHTRAAKKAKSKSPSSDAEPRSSATTRPPKGASLANPHKKARKYQEVEFEDD